MSSTWGDDDDQSVLPPRTETGPNADGIKTIVEWKRNNSGKRVRVTKRIKVSKVEVKISRKIAERRTWAKFGASVNDVGVNRDNTMVSGDDVFIEDPAAPPKPDASDDLLKQLTGDDKNNTWAAIRQKRRERELGLDDGESGSSASGGESAID